MEDIVHDDSTPCVILNFKTRKEAENVRRLLAVVTHIISLITQCNAYVSVRVTDLHKGRIVW